LCIERATPEGELVPAAHEGSAGFRARMEEGWNGSVAIESAPLKHGKDDFLVIEDTFIRKVILVQPVTLPWSPGWEPVSCERHLSTAIARPWAIPSNPASRIVRDVWVYIKPSHGVCSPSCPELAPVFHLRTDQHYTRRCRKPVYVMAQLSGKQPEQWEFHQSAGGVLTG